MKASIIIPTYNRTDFLGRAIKSVLNQNFQDYEIIVVDDNGLGTTQQIETAQLLKSFDSSILRYLPLAINSGGCVARNEGVKAACGEYIFFLDDDDEFLPNKLKIQTDFLDNNSEYDGCLSGFKRFSENGSEIIAESNFPVTGDFKNFAINGNFFTLMLCIRKKSFEKSGGFENIPRFQDRYFMLHCLKLNMRFKDLNDQLFVVYEHQGERVSNKGLEKSIESLTVIKNYIEILKADFSKSEWNNFEYEHLFSIGILHYVNPSYSIKIQGIKYWARLFLLKFKLADLLMILKSFVPKKYNSIKIILET